MTGAIGALGYALKPTIIIYIISFIVIHFLVSINRKAIIYGLLLLVMSISIGMIVNNVITKNLTNFYHISKQQYVMYQMPKIHWIMMSLKGDGGYNIKDVAFTSRFKSYNSKQNADLILLRSRVATYGISGMTKHCLYKKVKRTWCNSALGANDYISRKPYHKGRLYQLMAIDGHCNWLSIFYMYIWWILILAGVICSFIIDHSRNYLLSMFRLSLIGIFAFELLWECNARYLLIFIPAMVTVAVNGWNKLFDKLLMNRGNAVREGKND